MQTFKHRLKLIILEKCHIATIQMCESCQNFWVSSWDGITYKSLPANIGKLRLVKCAIQNVSDLWTVISKKWNYLNMLQFIPDFIPIDNYLPDGDCYYGYVDTISCQTVYQSNKADIKQFCNILIQEFCYFCLCFPYWKTFNAFMRWNHLQQSPGVHWKVFIKEMWDSKCQKPLTLKQ